MMDFSWLAQEAKSIHLIFESLFFSIVTLLLVIGVALEYMKMPIGGAPSFVELLGRAFLAALMLVSFPEFLYVVGEVTDGLTDRIGSLNKFDVVLDRISEQLSKLTWSWTSVKQMTLVTISFVSFFLLYISVYVSEAIYFYAWTLLYIFSPLCFALYVIPSTSKAATGIYKSILMVASWKVIWAILATLLWSAALIDLEKLGEDSDFLTLVLFNLMLAFSLLFTPIISRMLFKGNFGEAASKMSGAAVGSVAYGASKVMATPVMQKAGNLVKRSPQKGFHAAADKIRMMKDDRAVKRDPSLVVRPENLPSYQAEQKKEQKKLQREDRAVIRKSPYKKYMRDELPSSIAKRTKKKGKR